VTGTYLINNNGGEQDDRLDQRGITEAVWQELTFIFDNEGQQGDQRTSMGSQRLCGSK
jgi:hypothetical protein